MDTDAQHTPVRGLDWPRGGQPPPEPAYKVFLALPPPWAAKQPGTDGARCTPDFRREGGEHLGLALLRGSKV